MDKDLLLEYHTASDDVLGIYEADPLADVDSTAVESSPDFKEEIIENLPTGEQDPLADVTIVTIDSSLNTSDGELESILSVEANFLVNIPQTSPLPETTKTSSGDGLETEPRRRRLKRRKVKASEQPKMPLTGYVRFINARREELRLEFPEKSSMEYTRMICDEWKTMSAEKKAPYLEAAEVDKERYVKKLSEFLKERPEALASELIKTKIRKRKIGFVNDIDSSGTSQVNLNENHPPTDANSQQILQRTQITQTNNLSHYLDQSYGELQEHGDIPIFTKEFLEHNKKVDMELRTLRKTNIDFEQQNALLEKHVQTMKVGIENISTENVDLQVKNCSLETYMVNIRRKLTQALAGLGIPSAPVGPTRENIDKYMNDLCEMNASSGTNGSASLALAKDIIGKLDLTIPL